MLSLYHDDIINRCGGEAGEEERDDVNSEITVTFSQHYLPTITTFHLNNEIPNQKSARTEFTSFAFPFLRSQVRQLLSLK